MVPTVYLFSLAKTTSVLFLFLTVCATMNTSEMSSYLSIHLLSHCSTSQFAVTNKTSVRQPWKLVGNPVARENCIPQPAGEWLPAVTSWNLLQNAHITEKNSLWLLWLLAHCSGQPWRLVLSANTLWNLKAWHKLLTDQSESCTVALQPTPFKICSFFKERHTFTGRAVSAWLQTNRQYFHTTAYCWSNQLQGPPTIASKFSMQHYISLYNQFCLVTSRSNLRPGQGIHIFP